MMQIHTRHHKDIKQKQYRNHLKGVRKTRRRADTTMGRLNSWMVQ